MYQIDMLNETHNPIPIGERKHSVFFVLNLVDVLLNLIMQSNVLEKTALQFSKPLHGIRQQLKICSSSIELNQGSFVAFGLFTCYLIYHLLIALRKVFVAPEEVLIFACISHKFTCFQFSAIDID